MPIVTPKIVGMVAAIMVITFGMAVPATAQHCVTVECFNAECVWVGPGHRRCRRICRRRCYYPPPQYVPPPVYDPPAYVEPVRHYAPGPSPDGGLVALGVLFVIVLVIAGALASESTEATKRDEAQTRALVDKLDEAAREADAHIAGFLEQERRKDRDNG